MVFGTAAVALEAARVDPMIREAVQEEGSGLRATSVHIGPVTIRRVALRVLGNRSAPDRAAAEMTAVIDLGGTGGQEATAAGAPAGVVLAGAVVAAMACPSRAARMMWR